MTTAQTESRAIVRWTRDAAGWVEWRDGEWVRYSDHTTALAAKDAELAAVQVSNNKWLAKWERAEAQLAKARKALEEAREVVDACAGDNRPAREWALTVRDGIDAALAARRALEGGE